MRIIDLFSAQLEREAVVTRRALERVPEGRADWKPHEKSMPLGYLSTLVGTMLGWIAMMVTRRAGPEPAGRLGRKATRAQHDPRAARGAGRIRRQRAGSAAHHKRRTPATSWRLLVAGQVVLENPRHVAIADTFTHLAHHRGQLTVYLRLNGVAVPAIYGPSADDSRFE